MIRCLHLADLHLGWSPDGRDFPSDKVRIRRQERDSVFETAVNWAIDPENGIDFVIIAGDLFETHTPDPALVEYVLSLLRRLEGAGIRTITVPGNHDEITYHNSVYREYGSERTWPGILVRNPMPDLVCNFDVKGVSVFIYSLAYTGGLTKVSRLTDFPRQDEPGLHIGIFHGSLDWDGVSDRSLPLESQRLASAGYDYVALGHIHKYREMRVGRGLAVYPGLIESKGFSDLGCGCMTIAGFEPEDDFQGSSGFRVSLESVNIPVREHVVLDVDISTKESHEEIVSECKMRAQPDAMARIALRGVPSFDVESARLRASLQEHFFWVELEDESSFFESGDIARFAEEPTIRGYFVRKLLDRLEDSTSERAKEVLRLALRKGLAAFEGR